MYEERIAQYVLSFKGCYWYILINVISLKNKHKLFNKVLIINLILH